VGSFASVIIDLGTVSNVQYFAAFVAQNIENEKKTQMK
jgi:hypothetical protein